MVAAGVDRAGFLSRQLVAWATPIAWQGFQRPLQETDLPGAPKLLRSAASEDDICRIGARLWAAEVTKTRALGRKPSLFMTWLRIAPKQWFLGSLLGIVCGITTNLARPFLLRELIRALDPEQYSMDAALGIAAAFAVLCAFESWTRNMSRYEMGDCAPLMSVSATIQMVAEKSTRLRVGAGIEGAETALVGNDLFRLADMFGVFPQGMVAVGSLIGGTIMLLYLMGWTSLLGLSVMIVGVIISERLQARAKKLVGKMYGAADRRIGVCREIVDGSKVVKMQVWEGAYLSRIGGARTAELSFHRRYRLLVIICVAIGRSSPMAGAAVAIAVYSRYTALQIETILPALSVFSGLRLPFILIPLVLQLSAVASVSIRRVASYLSLPEQPPRQVQREEQSAQPAESAAGDEGDADGGKRAAQDVTDEALLRFESAAVGWPRKSAETTSASAATAPAKAAAAVKPAADAAAAGDDVVLTADLAVRPGEMVALVGPVGSGKSTVLAAAWGEANVSSGTVRGVSTVGVVPQRAFTLAGTLSDNVLMGRERDEARLAEVLAMCAMEQDLEKLPLRLETEVGERGVTLSGGQQQRLALARALYASPDLLLLDDPLSAVDARTQTALLSSIGAYVSAGGEGGQTRRRAALIAVNQLHLVPSFDRVIEISDGKIVRDCTSAEFVASTGSVLQGQQSVDDVASSVPASDGGNGKTEEPAEPPPTTAKPGAAATNGATNGGIDGATTDGTPQLSVRASKAPAPASVKRLFSTEQKKSGQMGSRLLLTYFRAMGWGGFGVYFLLFVSSYTAVGVTDLILSVWSSSADGLSEERNTFYLTLFLGLAGVQILVMLSTSITWSINSIRASKNIHHRTISRLIHAPLSWFEANPSGRVMSRFSADLGVCDMNMWQDIDTVFQLCGFFSVALVLVAVQSRGVLALPGAITIGVFYALLQVTDRSTREVKRLSNNAAAPILSTVNEMKQGAPIFRALRVEGFMAGRCRACVSRWSGLSFHHKALNVWGAQVVLFSSCFLALAAAFFFIGFRNPSQDASIAALGLTYAGQVPYFANITASLYAQMRQSMTAFERLLEYLELPQEPHRKLRSDPAAGTWPKDGSIEFEDVSLRYRPGLPLALDSFSARIAARERVGIVGRTGAGKSTLMLALFRLVDYEAGAVRIDGREVRELGLDTTRKCITIIPQEPVLFKGTVAHNLDPFDAASQAAKEAAVVRARLPADMLSLQVEKAGANLSAGERQLLCFARAMLQPRPIMMLDEATSNLDSASDDAMQKLLRSEFRDLTLLTIAHRLHTVIDYDSIVVLGKGKLLERGAPSELLEKDGGVLRGLAEALGEAAAKELRAKAKGGK